MKQITFSTFVIQEELHLKKKKVTTKGWKAGPLQTKHAYNMTSLSGQQGIVEGSRDVWVLQFTSQNNYIIRSGWAT